MEVVAKTKEKFLIEATEEELKEIINAVIGKKPESIEIGQKIPAIDYASSITKVKLLKKSYQFTSMISKIKEFNNSVESIIEGVENASNIEV